MDGVERIAFERDRQRGMGFTAEHDDAHNDEELGRAGAYYATPASMRDDIVASVWPQGWEFKPSFNRRYELERAGALIAAEIDRLDRMDERG